MFSPCFNSQCRRSRFQDLESLERRPSASSFCANFEQSTGSVPHYPRRLPPVGVQVSCQPSRSHAACARRYAPRGSALQFGLGSLCLSSHLSSPQLMRGGLAEAEGIGAVALDSQGRRRGAAFCASLVAVGPVDAARCD
ncbi:hypothetical protein EJ06DRAFT_61956 [Trichodelitschia bisporula]|uniref:Uncharacterized protein n=1 Tax=Trichodelitschia bisporula TaxID=703511 RepID=A0A6G1HUK5_9PEZI|nr:hypothetical protein EJ06DRAFT_61956 [Trichodelitschia bisporula]